MKSDFEVRVIDFRELTEIEGAWSTADFEALLVSMDFEDTGAMQDAEIREMAILALQDLEPEAAAELVLKQRLGDRLNAGQIQNAANEMPDEKLWEEYADLSLHEGMFNVASVLYAAYPRTFPKPDAVHVTLEVSASRPSDQQQLAGTLDEAFLVRLLADGMDDNSVLNRLFEDQLKGTSFPEAANIAWIWEVDASKAPVIRIGVISSGCWLDPLRNTKLYKSTAYFDEVEEDSSESG